MIVNKIVHGEPASSIPGHISFGQYVIDKLREHSAVEDNIAMINGDTDNKTTYKQFLQNIVDAATGIKKMGIQRGDVVAVCSENRDEFYPAVVGAICCGAAITTLNILYSKDEMTHALSISRPNTIFCSEAALQRNLGIIKTTPYIKNIIQLNGQPVEKGIIAFNEISTATNAQEFEPEEVQGWSDTLFILYSSGTTGMPKGVMLTHLNVLYAMTGIDSGHTRDACSRFITIIPWFHTYGLITSITYTTMNKMLIYFSGFNPEKYLSMISEYKVNVLIAVPPVIVFLMKSPLVEKYDMSSIELVWCGAAPLSTDTVKGTMKRLPNCKGLLQGYGMTEATLAAVKDIDNINVIRKPGCSGYPIPGMKVKVVDLETRQKLGPNQEGEICLKGPMVMKGYANNEAATRDMIDDEGYLKSGDIGYYDEDGGFFIVDRLKELIKYKGYQVPPALVESVVLQHASVGECGVVGAPDEEAGELATAFVVLKPGEKLTEQELLEFTTKRLSPVTRLRGGIIFIDEIPKSASGKILRRVLKQMLIERIKK